MAAEVPKNRNLPSGAAGGEKKEVCTPSGAATIGTLRISGVAKRTPLLSKRMGTAPPRAENDSTVLGVVYVHRAGGDDACAVLMTDDGIGALVQCLRIAWAAVVLALPIDLSRRRAARQVEGEGEVVSSEGAVIRELHDDIGFVGGGSERLGSRKSSALAAVTWAIKLLVTTKLPVPPPSR